MHRNSFRLLSSLVLSLAPAALAAEPLVWGQVELRAGIADILERSGSALSANSERDHGNTDLLGRIGADWGRVGVQLDLSFSHQELTFPSGGVFPVPDDDIFNWGQFGAVRANYDVSDSVTLGAVYGAGETQSIFDNRSYLDFYALEGAFSAGRAVYGLQLGAFDATDLSNTNAFNDGTFARASVIYTLGNGGVIEAEVAYFTGQHEPVFPSDMQAATFGVEYSQQVGDNPFAWSVGLDGGSYDSENGNSFSEARIMLGLTTWFGDGDLASAKRRGIFSQPDFARIQSAGNSLQ